MHGLLCRTVQWKIQDINNNAYNTSYTAAELADLVKELQEVNNWIPFGLNLGIDISKLEAIEKVCPTIEERHTQLFIYWQNQVVPTWSAVVQALMAIGKRRLAYEIAQKHGRYPLMEISLHTACLGRYRCEWKVSLLYVIFYFGAPDVMLHVFVTGYVHA